MVLRLSYAITLGVIVAGPLFAQQSQLTVDKITQDPDTWIGSWPRTPFWSEDGQTLYFRWNPMGTFPSDSLFKVPRSGGTPAQLTPEERRGLGPSFTGWHHGELVYDATFSRKVYVQRGDLHLYHRDSGETVRLTQTRRTEYSPRFNPEGNAIVFTSENNLFELNLATGAMRQLTDLRSGKAPQEPNVSGQAAFLEAQQSDLFAFIRKQQEEDEMREAAQERDEQATDPPTTYYLDGKNPSQLRIDPTERFVTFVITEDANAQRTVGMDYVTESGYAAERSARPKVGTPYGEAVLFAQDLVRDTTYAIDLHQIEGAYDVPQYLREQGAAIDSAKTKRALYSFGPFWNADGSLAVLEIRARDHKDRWLTRLDPVSGSLTLLDRQHDDAWIAGPGISWFGGASEGGWLPDGHHYWFQSETSGYSHLYTVNVETGAQTQLTSGAFEVFNPQISQDGTQWYFTSTQASPFVRHLYRMPILGGEPQQLTTMEGRNSAVVSPDGAMLGILRSFTTQSPEVYLQAPGMEPDRLTYSQTEEWLAYPWRVPETIYYEASDGIMVPAHLFTPSSSNGAAVLFVHGAGYAQNVHDGWSSYYREYMFHNLLTDLGYTVMQVDFRASSGYGRDWRTAIYRHMGGRDLQDYVDASTYLQERFGISADRIGIYGGSYGGFITLMALFTEPEHFGAGAALRSVTDWAHYNDPYTSNILNTPETDSLSFARSSPINFADGLEDPLLMPHGILDLNVQFQDIVRLGQRLIELGKDDWEIAIYPVEGHGFQEPSSWRDEYRRILKLFERHIGNQAAH